jgi:hypothetical protein
VAVKIEKDGSFQVIYGGAWKGLNVEAPPNLLDDLSFPAMSNIMLRNSAIQSRPALTKIINKTGFAPLVAFGTMLSSAYLPYTFAIDTLGDLFSLSEGPLTWTAVGSGANSPYVNNPALWRVFQNTLYYVNGSDQVSSWNPATATFTPNAITVGGNNVGALFIDELDQHVILANTNEAGTLFPYRLRWSAVGLPTMFDPAVNINAGFNDFIDVPDILCGTMMLGTVGYLFHQTGITQMSPTGEGASPFQFDHIWNSSDGTGAVWPYTIAQYGQVGAFVSKEEIYLVQNYAFTPIGGGCRDAIMADIQGNAYTYTNSISGNVYAPVMASIIPAYNNGFVHLVYQIIINGAEFSRVYEYSIENGYWEVYNFYPSFASNIVTRPFLCQT